MHCPDATQFLVRSLYHLFSVVYIPKVLFRQVFDLRLKFGLKGRCSTNRATSSFTAADSKTSTRIVWLQCGQRKRDGKATHFILKIAPRRGASPPFGTGTSNGGTIVLFSPDLLVTRSRPERASQTK